MSYMSYCVFEGVSSDIGTCIDALQHLDDLSERESNYAKRLRTLCEQYIDAYDEWIEYNNNENEE